MGASDKYKRSQRTAAGADKWLDMRLWEDTTSCLAGLKAAGYQVVVTSLQQHSVTIQVWGHKDCNHAVACHTASQKVVCVLHTTMYAACAAGSVRLALFKPALPHPEHLGQVLTHGSSSGHPVTASHAEKSAPVESVQQLLASHSYPAQTHKMLTPICHCS